ncbi:hypothetical protein [Streptomyces sp. A5-4]|uniref:hypothetical protein n=1 Tax=Streptomyces sp. A5-4 TaxID=3384771 RepID=UPI003DA8971E
MSSEEFEGRDIEVIDFDDVSSGEHVIEFRDPQVNRNDSILAISIPEDGAWGGAVVSVDPRVGDIPVAFMIWAIKIAQARMR